MDNVSPFLFSMSSQSFFFFFFPDISLFGVLLKLCQGKEDERRRAKTGLEKSQIHPYVCFCFLLFLWKYMNKFKMQFWKLWMGVCSDEWVFSLEMLMGILNYFDQTLITVLNYFHPLVWCGRGKLLSDAGVSALLPDPLGAGWTVFTLGSSALKVQACVHTSSAG